MVHAKQPAARHDERKNRWYGKPDDSEAYPPKSYLYYETTESRRICAWPGVYCLIIGMSREIHSKKTIVILNHIA